MSFFVDKWPIREVRTLGKQHSEYKKYLESIQSRLPSSAIAFATAAWHYDVKDHRALHDSWLESLTIREISVGEHRQHRSIEIQIRLLGAYHDGHTVLIYQGVRGYSFTLRCRESSTVDRIGHADLLVDEFALSPNGLLVHELLFSSGGTSWIECQDFHWEWQATQG